MQQWSADVQHELPGNMSVTTGYVGSRGDNQSYGFNVNINQLPTEYLSLGSRLTSLVPNPFFGVAGAGTLATQANVQLNSLLVPFPQYGLNRGERYDSRRPYGLPRARSPTAQARVRLGLVGRQLQLHV